MKIEVTLDEKTFAQLAMIAQHFNETVEVAAAKALIGHVVCTMETWNAEKDGNDHLSEENVYAKADTEVAKRMAV